VGYLWATGLVVVNLLWLALVLLGLPGNWLMVASTLLVAWARWDGSRPAGEQMFSLWTLGVVVALAGLGELVEFLAGVAGARRGGGSAWGALGALLGGLVGAVVGSLAVPVPVLGTLIGACVGAGVGALLLELGSGRRLAVAVRSGVGGGVGRLLGTLGKLAVSVAIWLIVAVAAFWP